AGALHQARAALARASGGLRGAGARIGAGRSAPVSQTWHACVILDSIRHVMLAHRVRPGTPTHLTSELLVANSCLEPIREVARQTSSGFGREIRSSAVSEVSEPSVDF